MNIIYDKRFYTVPKLNDVLYIVRDFIRSQVLTITSLLFLDDIITPVYVAPTRLPTTLRPKLHKENMQAKICDDEEDCEEGSGDSRTTEEIFVTSATGSYSKTLFCFWYISNIFSSICTTKFKKTQCLKPCNFKSKNDFNMKNNIIYIKLISFTQIAINLYNFK